MRPGSTRLQRNLATRDAILSAAITVFARNGVHRTRVADIADEAKIAYGLVYRHFRNKEDILTTIFQETWDRYVEFLKELAALTLPFSERLHRLIHYWLEAYRRHPEMTTLMINEIGRSYDFVESHDVGRILLAFDPIEKIVRNAQAEGEIRADLDPALVTYALVGISDMILTGYVMRTLHRRNSAAFAADENQLVNFILHGIDLQSQELTGHPQVTNSTHATTAPLVIGLPQDHRDYQ